MFKGADGGPTVVLTMAVVHGMERIPVLGANPHVPALWGLGLLSHVVTGPGNLTWLFHSGFLGFKVVRFWHFPVTLGELVNLSRPFKK